jgi:hypothetical protein
MLHLKDAKDAWHRALHQTYAQKLAELNNPLNHIQRWTDLLKAMQIEDLWDIIKFYNPEAEVF